MPKQTISAEGKAAAEADLEHLVNVRRPEIVQAIKVAREFGDLKENAEYHAAKDEQGLNESRIRSLERQLANSEVGEAAADGSASVGSKVSFRDAGSGALTEVTLVHPLEAKAAEGKLSVESPIGRALLGGREGQQVTAQTPRGEKQVEIVAVG